MKLDFIFDEKDDTRVIRSFAWKIWISDHLPYYLASAVISTGVFFFLLPTGLTRGQ
jgi:hypothetical protein